MEIMPGLGVIVVNYGNPDRTVRFVRAECPKIGMEHMVFVVDNGSGPDAVAQLNRELGKSAIIIRNPDNEGFARANNLGAQYAIEHFSPFYLLFVNNDIVFLDANVVDALAAKLETVPDAGMIGPKVVGLDGRLQSPEPFLTFPQRHILPYWGKFLKRDNDYSERAQAGFHYRIMGSFMLMRTADFKACGGMDPATFLYAEESILSERLRKIGKGVWYEPSVSVIHEHGTTTSRAFGRRRIRRMKLESDIYYYKTYRKVSFVEIAIARMTLWIKDRMGL